MGRCFDIQRDVFFLKEYGKLYEAIDNAELKVFSFSCELGEIYYQFLKREVPFRLDGAEYYDAMTPYGYGGPIILRAENGKKLELIEKFRNELDTYMHDNHIICEFVRFHPIRNNAADFKEMYSLWNCRTAVCTDCLLDNPVEHEFHPDTKRRIRKSIENGVSAKVFECPTCEQIEQFIACYYENMDRINASKYYYFNQDYFLEMQRTLNERLILVLAFANDEVIGADLGFSDGDLYTRHLSGITDTGNRLGVARVMASEQVRWAAGKGYKYVYHGCGLTTDDNDSLLNFKKFFTKGSFFQYWQGNRVIDIPAYDRICSLLEKDDDGSFFPAYRKE